MACGPYNAIRALRQCASDNFSVIHNINRAVEAKESILSNFYVDDYLDSVNTTTVASTESFPSNSDTTVLGLHWNPNNDTLFYKVRLPVLDAIPTKRNVLSDVARLYDPSGLLSPVIVWAKIFIQMLWKAELPWDTPLPGDLRDEWLTFRNGLYQLFSIRVLHWLGMTKTSTVNFHGFCDASSKAYAAVVYVRIEDPEGEVRVSLVAAKTRVGPSKSTTIPRMELSAARLLAMTMEEICHALRLDSAGCMYWSDSTIVLHWIQKAPTVLKPYQIAELSECIENSNDENQPILLQTVVKEIAALRAENAHVVALVNALREDNKRLICKTECLQSELHSLKSTIRFEEFASAITTLSAEVKGVRIDLRSSINNNTPSKQLAPSTNTNAASPANSTSALKLRSLPAASAKRTDKSNRQMRQSITGSNANAPDLPAADRNAASSSSSLAPGLVATDNDETPTNFATKVGDLSSANGNTVTVQNINAGTAGSAYASILARDNGGYNANAVQDGIAVGIAATGKRTDENSRQKLSEYHWL
ncbi:PREDICTED: uncharacterized protein LOC108361477 [Rhagoletis zephyria]|uniref:uncharacterized protein LOC108361477 n=1 Tax=Rhagoletis zephyria TaxID=28612 RepID=UPI0008116930|nr:PREDICTED: uncharacterized protein LOC108361477 [Rhagoletis zephyria]